MKKQIVQVSALQFAKVMAALYFVISIPLALIMSIPAMLNGSAAGVSLFMLVLMPVLYTFFGFLFTLLGAWVYNMVAARIGGFEYQTVEVGND
jgi:ABC-type long-subunit fatty acid transport system fused permease/ATPase subunit